VADLRSQSPSDIQGQAPVSVSSANYRETSYEELQKSVDQKSAINPPNRASDAKHANAHYIFVKGEVFETDLDFDRICRMLEPSLKKRGYTNAADTQGRIPNTTHVTLILRVSFGIRPWRLPTVRTDNLYWADGMEPRPRGTGLTNLGGEVVFERRAGGNDDALSAAAANAGSSSFNWGGGKSGSTASSAAGGNNLANQIIASTSKEGLTGYSLTRDYSLIVIDAFDYVQLKEKGRNARRAWSTFVSAPHERGQKLSDVAGTLISVASNYWGDTTQGLQVFSDARAHVELGTPTILPDEPSKP